MGVASGCPPLGYHVHLLFVCIFSECHRNCLSCFWTIAPDWLQVLNIIPRANTQVSRLRSCTHHDCFTVLITMRIVTDCAIGCVYTSIHTLAYLVEAIEFSLSL